MAVTGFFHHIGSFFLFAATILLLVTTISAPVVNNLALLKVTLSNATTDNWSQVSFGTFGYCVLDTANGNQDYCTGSHVGYNAAGLMEQIEDTSFSNAAHDTVSGLTRVMVLHPVATVISFIAFLLALGAGFIGSLTAALVSLVGLVVTIVVLVCDFVMWGIVRDHINSGSDDSSGSKASFSVAIWTILAAAVCSLLGVVILFFTCCSARLHKRRNDPAAKTDYGTATTTRRRKWF